MPVDPASLVALSGLAARDLPDDAALIADAAPAAPEVLDVDVPAPFWTEPPASGTGADAVVVEHLSDVGIGLVAAAPEPVEAARPPRLPQRPPSLTALTAASREFASRHLPAIAESSRQLASRSTALHPAAWRMPDLGTFPTLDADARRRLALLAGGSVAAGLACGLAVPVAAEATPATHGTTPSGTAPTPSGTLLAAASIFDGAGSDGATADPSAVVIAAPAPTRAATSATAKPRASQPVPVTSTAAKPTTAKPAPTTPLPPAAPTSGSGDGRTVAIAALLGPATTPFAGSSPSAEPAAPAAEEPPATVPAGPAATASEPATAVSSAPAETPAAASPAAAAPAAPPASSASPASLPGRTATAAAAVVVVADPAPPRPGDRPAPVKPAKPAWTPTRPLPAHSGTGRRIVYAERTAHLWIVGADGTVLRDYKVTGRADRPRPGTYHVFSKSRTTSNPKEKLTFDLMVRFTHGVTGAPIGFHTIPKTYSGHPIQAEKDLGRAIGMGGCVRQSRVDAEWLYAWSRVGDTVVVLH